MLDSLIGPFKNYKMLGMVDMLAAYFVLGWEARLSVFKVLQVADLGIYSMVQGLSPSRGRKGCLPYR